jgi:hypothetical protein
MAVRFVRAQRASGLEAEGDHDKAEDGNEEMGYRAFHGIPLKLIVLIIQPQKP